MMLVGPRTPLTKGIGLVSESPTVWTEGAAVPALGPRMPSTKGIGLVSEAPTVWAAGLTTLALGPRTPLTNGMTFQTDGLTTVMLRRRARTAANVPAARRRVTR
jgi:hypothetical protein